MNSSSAQNFKNVYIFRYYSCIINIDINIFKLKTVKYRLYFLNDNYFTDYRTKKKSNTSQSDESVKVRKWRWIIWLWQTDAWISKKLPIIKTNHKNRTINAIYLSAVLTIITTWVDVWFLERLKEAAFGGNREWASIFKDLGFQSSFC